MTLDVLQADITTLTVDAIVNAANSSLLGGGGVDGAIHRRGGPALLEACRQVRARHGRCRPGDAVLTTGGALPARYVIHAVGPVWTGEKPEAHAALLRRCYQRSLELAAAHGIRSIAFPNISTGIYRFPKPLAATVALAAVRESPAAQALDRILFACLDAENFALYRQLLL